MSGESALWPSLAASHAGIRPTSVLNLRQIPCAYLQREGQAPEVAGPAKLNGIPVED
jgi:hypothetical protein